MVWTTDIEESCIEGIPIPSSLLELIKNIDKHSDSSATLSAYLAQLGPAERDRFEAVVAKTCVVTTAKTGVSKNTCFTLLSLVLHLLHLNQMQRQSFSCMHTCGGPADGYPCLQCNQNFCAEHMENHQCDSGLVLDLGVSNLEYTCVQPDCDKKVEWLPFSPEFLHEDGKKLNTLNNTKQLASSLARSTELVLVDKHGLCPEHVREN